MTSESGFYQHLNAVEPREVRSEDGWRNVDIRFLLPPSLQLSAPLGLFRAVFPPGAEHRAHTHPRADEFVFLVSGRAALGAAGEERDADPGTIQLVPAGVVHWLRNLDPDEPVEVVGGYLGVRSLDEAGYAYVPDHQLPPSAGTVA